MNNEPKKWIGKVVAEVEFDLLEGENAHQVFDALECRIWGSDGKERPVRINPKPPIVITFEHGFDRKPEGI